MLVAQLLFAHHFEIVLFNAFWSEMCMGKIVQRYAQAVRTSQNREISLNILSLGPVAN